MRREHRAIEPRMCPAIHQAPVTHRWFSISFRIHSYETSPNSLTLRGFKSLSANLTSALTLSPLLATLTRNGGGGRGLVSGSTQDQKNLGFQTRREGTRRSTLPSKSKSYLLFGCGSAAFPAGFGATLGELGAAAGLPLRTIP